MNKSKRHHYVPQFLMRHFTNENGKLHVYDKIENKFYDSSTENLFLQKGRNTFENLNGENDDIVEKVYSEFDSYFAGILKEITIKKNFDSKTIKSLISLAYLSKWRVRQYDESFKTAKDFFSVNDLGLGLKDENNERINIDLEKIFDSDMHQELKRILLAIQPIRFKDDFKSIFSKTFLLNTNFPSFISDCPFNEATIKRNITFEDFVFPIMKDLTLVHSSRIDIKKLQTFINSGNTENINSFLTDFSIARDISMLELCERNVACSDLKYLKHIVTNYINAKKRNKETPINLTVFNVIYRFEEYARR